MSRRTHAGATMEDVRAYAKSLMVEYALSITVQFDALHTSAKEMRVIVALADAERLSRGEEPLPITMMHGSCHTSGERMAAGVLLTISQAVAIYMDDPWSWTAKHRREMALSNPSIDIL